MSLSLLCVTTCCFFAGMYVFKEITGQCLLLSSEILWKTPLLVSLSYIFWPTLNHKMHRSQERKLILVRFHVPLVPCVCLSTFHIWAEMEHFLSRLKVCYFPVCEYVVFFCVLLIFFLNHQNETYKVSTEVWVKESRAKAESVWRCIIMIGSL